MFIAGLYLININLQKKFCFLKLAEKQNCLLSQVLETKDVFIFAGVQTKKYGSIFKTNRSIFVGKAFSNDKYKPFCENDLLFCEKNGAETLINNYWGAYAAISLTHNDNTLVQIILDPVGLFPLYYMRLSAYEVVFSSEISFIMEYSKKSLLVNLAYISKYLLESFITSDSTIFEDVSEIPPGCLLSISGKTTTTQLIWNPISIQSHYKSEKDIEEEVVYKISAVMNAWLEPYEAIALDFSGGLDSTGLLYILTELFKDKKEIIPINFYHPDVLASDERVYARNIASHLNLSILEFDSSKRLPFSPFDKTIAKKQNAPSSGLLFLKEHQDLNCALSEKTKDYIYMSGHGGDHIFQCTPNAFSICDLVLDGNKEYSIIEKTKELCAMMRKPIYSPLKSIVSGVWNYWLKKQYPRHQNRNSSAPTWVSSTLKKYSLTSEHPLFSGITTQLYPGKFHHLDIIHSGFASIHIDERSPSLPTFYPLFSQPLISLALSIPTYKFYSNGFNRYPYRQAIAKKFNTNLVWRKDKGETSGVSQLGLLHNRDYIFSLCLEGKLARDGLIHKDLLHKNLKALMHGDQTNQWRIFNLTSLETFFDLWNIK